MADASSGSSGGSGNSGRSHRSNHRRSCNVSKGSSSHSPASNSVNSVSSWARLNWPSTSDSLGNGTEIYGSIDEDREMAKKAVAFVLNSTSKGVVSLCSEVSSILKAKRSLERTVAVQRKELDSLRSALAINVANHSSALSSSEESNRSHKREPEFKTNRKPLLIHRSTSPVFKEGMFTPLSSCASQTEISSIQEWTSTRNMSNSVEQENIKLKNDLHNLQNELESIKRKGSLPQIICESRGTVFKTVGLSSSPSNENEKERKCKIISAMSPSPRQMETLNQDLELPHIPQAKYQGQAQDSKLSMSLQQKNRNGLRPFSSQTKVSPYPFVEQQPIRPVELHQQCKCAGCMAVLSEEHQAALCDHAPAIDKKFSSKRSEIFPRIGDHVVVRSHLTGIVRYIGPISDNTQSYIGLHLDAPVGNHNGSLDGKRFFSCPPNYGAFVPVDDVLCITSQKPARPRKDMRPSVTSLRQRSVSTPLSRPMTVESELPGVKAPV